MKRATRLVLAYLLCVGAGAACAAAQTDEITLGAGYHYSEGDYGTGRTTSIESLLFTGRYDKERWTFKAAVPYVSIEGSRDVVPGFGRVGPATRPSTASGIGDVTLSATYLAYHDAATQLGVDLTGRVKIATADADERLGTGEHDFGFQAEAFKTFGRTTAFIGVGYTVFGSSAEFPLDNALNFTLGGSYRIDARDSAGLSYDERERLTRFSAPLRELTAFWSRRLAKAWKAQLYFVKGLADGSPDWGVGASAAYAY